jgi:signal transduction histidine kinase
MRLEPALPALEFSDELRIALINLLDNALLASSQDDLTEIYAGTRGSRVRIEVIDRGRGMSSEVKEHAFDPFFTTREGEGGRGIGLHASRTTVNRLGGTVRLESAPGHGTKVTIEIPVC